MRVLAVQTTEDEIKRLIIEVLQLEDITPADIDADAPLFVEGLGLDSIDALDSASHLQTLRYYSKRRENRHLRRFARSRSYLTSGYRGGSR